LVAAAGQRRDAESPSFHRPQSRTLYEYAILALLAARAFRTSSRDCCGRAGFGTSLLLVIAYSLTDEFHQSFVPSRTASIYDSMIDGLGGLTALAMLWCDAAERKRRERRLQIRRRSVIFIARSLPSRRRVNDHSAPSASKPSI